MEIKLYGTGCHKCRQLFENAKTALDAAGIEAEIRKITDVVEITNAGILMTPALEIDGKIVASGKVLSASEILALLPAQKSCCTCSSCGQHAKATPQKACSRKSPWKKLLAYLLIAFAMTALAIVMIRENDTAPNTAVSEQNSEKLIASLDCISSARQRRSISPGGRPRLEFLPRIRGIVLRKSLADDDEKPCPMGSGADLRADNGVARSGSGSGADVVLRKTRDCLPLPEDHAEMDTENNRNTVSLLGTLDDAEICIAPLLNKLSTHCPSAFTSA